MHQFLAQPTWARGFARPGRQFLKQQGDIMPIKAKSEYSFTALPEEVDLGRIIAEAPEGTRCIRIKVENKTYTLVNLDWLDSTGFSYQFEDRDRQGYHDPDRPYGMRADPENDPVDAGLRHGEFCFRILRSITGESDQDADLWEQPSRWAVSNKDEIREMLDGVAVNVEVF